jgi:hypothetical protein
MSNVNYKMSKNRGALNEVEQAQAQSLSDGPAYQQASFDYAAAHHTDVGPLTRVHHPHAPPPAAGGAIRVEPVRTTLLWAIIDEGQQALVTRRDGRSQVLIGPKRVLRWGRRIRPLVRHVAHPGEFLIVRFKDGTQEHLRGPVDRWLDPREHKSIEQEEVLRLDAKEAVVVYAKAADDSVDRRIVSGPASFVPEPGEWLHTFSWHGSRWSNGRYVKIPGALEFQKLWLMPDQMYHDVPDVRTSDDALLTVRLMVFFELQDIERMLESTHDPIGDFVNAATSDVIDWVGRYDFDGFKRNTEQLNELSTYKQLSARASQCGYALHKVVYRGYGATQALQRMHDEAIESRTRLMLERATEQQAQELEDAKLEREHARAGRNRSDEADRVTHQIGIAARQQEAELAQAEVRRAFERSERERDEAAARAAVEARHGLEQRHLEHLSGLGVDLTKLLTRGAADQVLEVRGNGVPHLHLDRP